MVTKEEFIKLISAYKHYQHRVDQVCDALDCDLFQADWMEYTGELWDFTLSKLFTEEAVDNINWWLFEKCERPDYKMWDKDGNEIPTETLDDLWEIVKDFRK